MAIVCAHLLLHQLRWCDIVAGGHELFVSFATAHIVIALHCVVVNLAQRLVLLVLHL